MIPLEDDDYVCDEELDEILSELEEFVGANWIINCDHVKEYTNEANVDKTAIAITAGSSAVAGAAVPTAATAGLTAVGFTSSGIAGGSIAAGIQAGIGNVVAGSTFATLQSVGATGGFAILGPLGLIAAAVPLAIGGGIIATKLVKSKMHMNKIERERQMRIENGTAIKNIDICGKCWVKMRLKF